MLFNLCSERQYPASKFGVDVACFPFEDHQVFVTRHQAQQTMTCPADVLGIANAMWPGEFQHCECVNCRRRLCFLWPTSVSRSQLGSARTLRIWQWCIAKLAKAGLAP